MLNKAYSQAANVLTGLTLMENEPLPDDLEGESLEATKEARQSNIDNYNMQLKNLYTAIHHLEESVDKLYKEREKEFQAAKPNRAKRRSNDAEVNKIINLDAKRDARQPTREEANPVDQAPESPSTDQPEQ